MSEKVKPIETRRLILSEIKEEDTKLIVKWRGVPEVYQYFLSPKPITIDEHLNWYFNKYKEDKNRIDFMAIEKVTREKIGVFSIKRCIDSIQYSEFGYLLDKNAQRKGFAQEAIRELMNFTLENWKCKKAILCIHENNVASQLLANRLGYKEKVRKGKFVLYYADLVSCHAKMNEID